MTFFVERKNGTGTNGDEPEYWDRKWGSEGAERERWTRKSCTAPGRYCHSVPRLCTAALIMRASLETDNLVPPVQHAKQIPILLLLHLLLFHEPLGAAAHNSRLMGEPNDCRGGKGRKNPPADVESCTRSRRKKKQEGGEKADAAAIKEVKCVPEMLIPPLC